MQRPLQAVLVSQPEWKQAVLNGTTNTGYIYGHCNYHIGDVVFCSELEQWVIMAKITTVRHTTPKDITPDEYEVFGCRTMDDWIKNARVHKDPNQGPNIITAGSPITIIRWNNLSGSLVEEVEREKALKDRYPQDCQCEDYEGGLVVNDCHLHNENPRHYIGDEDVACDCDVWRSARVTCDMCASPAVWVRRTQFSGDHFFCDVHARVEADFGKEDSSYFFWKKLK